MLATTVFCGLVSVATVVLLISTLPPAQLWADENRVAISVVLGLTVLLAVALWVKSLQAVASDPDLTPQQRVRWTIVIAITTWGGSLAYVVWHHVVRRKRIGHDT